MKNTKQGFNRLWRTIVYIVSMGFIAGLIRLTNSLSYRLGVVMFGLYFFSLSNISMFTDFHRDSAPTERVRCVCRSIQCLTFNIKCADYTWAVSTDTYSNVAVIYECWT